jgi:hypothetical protein
MTEETATATTASASEADKNAVLRKIEEDMELARSFGFDEDSLGLFVDPEDLKKL